MRTFITGLIIFAVATSIAVPVLFYLLSSFVQWDFRINPETYYFWRLVSLAPFVIIIMAGLCCIPDIKKREKNRKRVK